MKSIIRIAVVTLFAAAPHVAWAHATIVKSEPAKDAQLKAAPSAIVLTFNEEIEPAFSSVKVNRHAGKAVAIDKAKVDAVDKKVLRAVVPALSKGKYTVKYSTMGRDGHKRAGAFDFVVK